MRLNNRGFAISTALYGLLALLILVVMLIFQVMRTGSNNSKELGQSIQTELDKCREERIEYNRCLDDDCSDKKSAYESCLNP